MATVGSGAYSYEPVESWAKLPPGWSFKEIGGVGVDGNDNVYVFNRGEHPIIVLDREGRVLGQLDHPNIVQAYAIDELNGSHYVAMEYVDGDNLQRWIRKLGRLSVEDAVFITMKIAAALDYAHAQGVIHRDLKPENILITKKGVVKIADFGMVKVSDEEMDLTQTGHALGTPWYMPLEQAKNAKASTMA